MSVTIEYEGKSETVSLSLFDEACLEEYCRIETLEDKDEQERRYELLEDIQRACGAYYDHIREYEFGLHYKKLEKRGIVLTPIVPAHVSKMKTKWSRLFASALSKREKEEIHYDEFRWHIFSYDRVACLVGDEARSAFDACKKTRVFQFFQHDNSGFCIDNAMLLKAADFDYENTPTKADTYILDAAGRWTYVRTHEESCGPYFCYKNGQQIE